MRFRDSFVVLLLLFFLVGSLVAPLSSSAEDVGPLLLKLHAVAAKGVGNQEAAVAWRELVKADVSQLPAILEGLDAADPLAANWIRGAVDTIAEAEMKKNGTLPLEGLESYLEDETHSPRGRRLAYEWIVRVDPAAEDRLIPNMLNDPSLELRRDAVDRVVAQAAAAESSGNKEVAIAAYLQAIHAARDLDQIKSVTEKLRSFGAKVDLPSHFGFLMTWHLVAPFDNREGVGFDKAYLPEREVDLQAKLQGQQGDVTWVLHRTNDEYGVVDLNETLGKFKGAVGYAYTTFVAAADTEVDIRLGCINAHKVWINGQLLTANQVYHSGMEIDQYQASCQLKKGKNTILVKICQNEQTESWAQRWQFQLRVCDETGTAIASVVP